MHSNQKKFLVTFQKVVHRLSPRCYDTRNVFSCLRWLYDPALKTPTWTILYHSIGNRFQSIMNKFKIRQCYPSRLRFTRAMFLLLKQACCCRGMLHKKIVPRITSSETNLSFSNSACLSCITLNQTLYQNGYKVVKILEYPTQWLRGRCCQLMSPMSKSCLSNTISIPS